MTAIFSALLMLHVATAAPRAQQSPAVGAEAPRVRAAQPSRGSVADAPPSAALRALRSGLDSIVGGSGLSNSRWSVLVYSVDRGDTLFAHSPDLALAPASNMKLFTTAAALYYLGPAFRYRTYFMAHGPVRDGVLHGDVVLYGTGDPTLSERFGSRLSPFRAFADTLVALGIREVRGAVLGDASYFTGSGTADGWQESYMNAAYAAPASALSFAENLATLEIRPGEAVGWRPAVRLVPGGTGISIVNQATTVASGRTSIQAVRTEYDGPVVIRGRIAANSQPVVRVVPIADPGRYAAAVLREAIEDRGIVVQGGARGVMRPEESPVTGRSVFAPAYDRGAPLRVLAIHTSPPLQDMLDVVNRHSHNMLAEQTLRTVGRVVFGEGSIDAGARAVRYMLEAETGTAPATLHVADGSGLSVLNRASASAIVQLLAYMARSADWDAYWATLPEAGAQNGLRRMHQTQAEGNLRAKTGTISFVSALSGYVRALDGELLAFAIIANNVSSTWQAKRVEDAIGARLAAFARTLPTAAAATTVTRVPPVDTLGARTAVRAQTARTHTIRPGDTLAAIARQYGTTVAALQRANPQLDPRRLRPGQQVRLP